VRAARSSPLMVSYFRVALPNPSNA
jgi:hypothetical protein